MTVCGAFALALGFRQAHAAPDFIQTYLDAQGGCRSGQALSFVLAGPGRQAPFDKPAADWTDEDLAALRASLAACVEAAAASNNPYFLAETKQEVENLLAVTPQIVANARADREAEMRRLAARKELAQGRLEKATRDRDQARASAEAEVAKLEREATRAEAEAQAASATANRQIEDATRRTSNAKSAAAESLTVLRSRPSASANARPNIPPGEPQELEEDLLVTTTTNFVACKATEQLIEAAKGIVMNDMEKVAKYVKHGDCVVVDQGTKVRLRGTDASARQGVVCVGLAGHSSCLWMPSNIMQASK